MTTGDLTAAGGSRQIPDVAGVVSGLKDFQRATVDHVFGRLWTDPDHSRRFLVADEVGLGKTLIAKSVIAKAIAYLWDSVKRIDIVYICSNAQIANQNIRHLRTVCGQSHLSTHRLTLLSKVAKELNRHKVNFISFTPGTSFNLKSRGGLAEERVLLYWALAELWGRDAVRPERWYRFFEGQMDRARFKQLASSRPEFVDPGVLKEFGQQLKSQLGPGGDPLEDELKRCAGEFNYLRGKPGQDLSERRYALIGSLRTRMAHASIQALEPDLVILDEFQRFKDLLTPQEGEETAATTLAKAVFSYPEVRTLLLSATPYKMYTLPDEPGGDDHYVDFTRTLEFLAGRDQAVEIAHHLRVMRETLVGGGDYRLAQAAKNVAEQLLRKVMCRTERLAATPDRDGMLRQLNLPGVKITANDIRSWRSLDAIAAAVDSKQDVFEFWRSSPYPLSIMEPGNYKVNDHFRQALARQDQHVRNQVENGAGLLSWADIRSYRQLDPGNAKVRGLMADVLDRGVWRLAWLPPSLPYYQLTGPFAAHGLADFTKRLVFSAWNVVPKAISIMLSYEAERRVVEASQAPVYQYDQRMVSRPFEYKVSEGRPANMSLFTLMYPSVSLARLGDPWAIARELGSLAAPAATVHAVVRSRIEKQLVHFQEGLATGGRVDPGWYWAAPVLLDRLTQVAGQAEFEQGLRRSDGSEDGGLGLDLHVAALMAIDQAKLGRMPEDLPDVLARVALASPATVALRALSRVCGGARSLTRPLVREQAFTIATAFRLMLNKPDVVNLLRGDEASDTYWRAALQHCWEGCLQAVLDEYFHCLLESQSLQDLDDTRRAQEIAKVCQEALRLNSVLNRIEDIGVDSTGTMSSETRRIRLNIAARFGQSSAEDGAIQREDQVRTAFNSPFRPFVLSSTSVGQEGLDFHTYCHAVVHWNLPGNPVDLEQREGRVHRYKGHAVRKNVALKHAKALLQPGSDDPWEAMFTAAANTRAEGKTELIPYWVYPDPAGAAIERYVPVMPLSREIKKYHRLERTIGGYRLVMGQPRQEDLLCYLGEHNLDAQVIAIDLRPPSC